MILGDIATLIVVIKLFNQLLFEPNELNVSYLTALHYQTCTSPTELISFLHLFFSIWIDDN